MRKKIQNTFLISKWEKKNQLCFRDGRVIRIIGKVLFVSNLNHENLVFKADDVFHISEDLKIFHQKKFIFHFVNIKCNILYILHGQSNSTFNYLTFMIICQSLFFNLLGFHYLKLISCLSNILWEIYSPTSILGVFYKARVDSFLNFSGAMQG